jgi:hypothetical protein
MEANEQTCWGEYELSLEELEALPTLSEGQADNLKIESDTERVWLSRCTVEDGEPWDNKVTVERLIAGSWVEVEWWEAVSDGSTYPYDSFTLELELGNEAMQSPEDIADALRRVAQMIENSHGAEGSIMDNNGNTVGKFETR